MKKLKRKFYNVRFTDKQLFLVERCLEIVSRMSAGQLSHIEEAVSLGQGKTVEVTITPEVLNTLEDNLFGLKQEAKHSKEYAWFRLGHTLEKLTKPILFSNLHLNESYGIGSKEIPNAQIMYEMYKLLQNHRSKGKKDMGVLAHPPLKYSKEPLITVSSVE